MRPGHPDFLGLPWRQPLDAWSDEHCVDVAAGIHRHVVRFVDIDGALYACKELPPRLADREYRVLRRMAEEQMPVVEVVGVVQRRGLEHVVITRYLEYSLPFRMLFTHRRPAAEDEADPHSISGLHRRLLDAMTLLLARLHLAGFYWGDCSLSNTLFRRDAGALAAYIVDVETGEWHAQLSPGQRFADVEIARLNVAGGLMDLQAQLGLPAEPDPVEFSERLGQQYAQLWAELTSEVVIGVDERYRVDARLRRLNELGFDVDEVELEAADGGHRLRVRTHVAEQGHHRRRLLELTGLHAQANQARSLLNDLTNFRAVLEQRSGRPVPEAVAAYRWLDEVFTRVVEAIPPELEARLEPVEVFHEVIEHKWYLSEQEGADVGIDRALSSYLTSVLPQSADEQRVLGDEDTSEGWIGWG
ncbi:MAG: DUF4032 domain-containing protein [Actinobacteria bacterium]|nr:DUF4032 domain-containing protein [Actinomycetota bacterium]